MKFIEYIVQPFLFVSLFYINGVIFHNTCAKLEMWVNKSSFEWMKNGMKK